MSHVAPSISAEGPNFIFANRGSSKSSYKDCTQLRLNFSVGNKDLLYCRKAPDNLFYYTLFIDLF